MGLPLQLIDRVRRVGAHHAVGDVLAALVVSRLPPHVEATRWIEALGASDVPAPDLVAELADVDGEGEPGRSPSGVHVLGQAHEVLRQDRRASGAVYTPAALATGLAALALGDLPRPRVLDPAVGGGAFLVAAAEVLRERGVEPAEAVGELLWGSDLDPLAVAVTKATLAWWSTLGGGSPVWPSDSHVVVCDGLRLTDELGPVGFDVVLGNPPFQGQLRTRTRRLAPVDLDGSASAPGVVATPEVASSYADSAVLFLAAACALARPGGRVLLIQPQSALAARDAGPVRAAVAERTILRGAWVGHAQEFAAAVQVWAPLLEVRSDDGAANATWAPDPVPRWVGTGVVPATATKLQGSPRRAPGASWAPLVVDLLGGLTLDLEREGRCRGHLGDHAQVTAGFRQHFYGLAPLVGEAPHDSDRDAREPGTARLVTVGLIDPLHLQWGMRRARLAGRDLARPVVDLAALRTGDQQLCGWLEARLRPKVLVATQTAVVEAVVDRAGDLVPSTPVISVEPHEGGRLDALAAVLCAPPVTAWMLQRRAGSGLSGGAMRVSAADVAGVPLPEDEDAWAVGAAWVRRAEAAAAERDQRGWAVALGELGRAMTAAYGLDPAHPVVAWWSARLPSWRTAP